MANCYNLLKSLEIQAANFGFSRPFGLSNTVGDMPMDYRSINGLLGTPMG